MRNLNNFTRMSLGNVNVSISHFVLTARPNGDRLVSGESRRSLIGYGRRQMLFRRKIMLINPLFRPSFAGSPSSDK